MTAYRIQLIRTPIAEPRVDMTHPDEVAGFCQGLSRLDREHLVRIDLDVRCRVIGYEHVSVGTSDYLVISPRHVFTGALLIGARQCVLVHNHPSSGEAEPSDEDLKTAQRLSEAGELLDLTVVDFLIIGDHGRYWSQQLGYRRVSGTPSAQMDLRNFTH